MTNSNLTTSDFTELVDQLSVIPNVLRLMAQLNNTHDGRIELSASASMGFEWVLTTLADRQETVLNTYAQLNQNTTNL